MRVESQRKLFVCLRVDNKMRDQLEHCAPRDKAYFDGSDPRYLQILRSPEESYIGKVVEPGVAAITMDDLKRNLVSILNRVAPGRHRDDAVKVFALDEGEPPALPEKEDAEDHHEQRGSYY